MIDKINIIKGGVSFIVASFITIGCANRERVIPLKEAFPLQSLEISSELETSSINELNLFYNFTDSLHQKENNLLIEISGISSLAISTNGNYIMIKSNLQSENIKISNSNTKKIIKMLSQNSNAIATGRDKQYIILSSNNNTVKLLDMKTGTLLKKFKVPRYGDVYYTQISTNGKYIVTSGDYTLLVTETKSKYGLLGSTEVEDYLNLWDTKTGTLIKSFKPSDSHFNISSNERYLIYAGWESIKIWDIKMKKLFKTIKCNSQPSSITISSDGKYLAYSENNKIKIQDIKTEKLIKTLEETTHSLAITSNGKYIVSGTNQGIHIWDIATAKVIKTLGKESMGSISISPNGKYILSSYRGGVKIWIIKDFNTNLLSLTDINCALNSIDEYQINSYSQNPFDDIKDITQKITNCSLKSSKIIKQTPAPKIKKPTLPPAPKLIKSEYETKVMFQKRVNKAIAQREAKVQALQKQYRIDVENRNKKIEAIKKRYLVEVENVKKEQAHKKTLIRKKIIEFQKGVFKSVMENFVLEKRSYDAENQILYATMRATRANYSKKISLKIPTNEIQNFVKHLKDIEVDAKFDFTGNQITLKSINANYQNKSFIAILSEKDFKPQNIEVAIKDKKVEFNSAKQMRLTLQNPNLKDTYQIEALAYSDGQEIKGINYQDDIPQLLESVKHAQSDNKKWLFVIGVEEYDNTDKVTYSKRSAEIFIKVAQKSLGITERNSYALIGNRATSGAIEDKLNRMIENIKEGDSIYFFYSGHGIPVLPSRVPYLLPKDKIPDYIGRNSFFKLTNIYNLLSKSKAGKVIAIMDSCFSGSTDGKSVFKGVAGSVLIPKKVTFDHQKMVVLTAGRDKQFSNMFPKRGHRLFSYFVMKALLEGKRGVSDIYNSVYPHVKEVSNGFGDLKKQEPTIEGNKMLRF